MNQPHQPRALTTEEYRIASLGADYVNEANDRTVAVCKDNKQQAIMMYTFGLYLGATGNLPDFIESAYEFNTEDQKNNAFTQSDAQRLIKLNGSILTQMDAHHKDTLAAVKLMVETVKAAGVFSEVHAELAKNTRRQVWELRKTRNALAETQRKLKKFRY